MDPRLANEAEPAPAVELEVAALLRAARERELHLIEAGTARPMTVRYLLDTDTGVAWLRRNQAVRTRVAAVGPPALAVSIVTVDLSTPLFDDAGEGARPL